MFPRPNRRFGATLVMLGVAFIGFTLSGCREKPAVTRGNETEIQQHRQQANGNDAELYGIGKAD